MISGNFTVTTGAVVQLVAPGAGNVNNSPYYVSIGALTNPVVVGGSNVTGTTGIIIAAGSNRDIQLQPNDALWGISTTGNSTVTVMRPGS